MKRLLTAAIVALSILSAAVAQSAPARALIITPRRVVSGDDFGPKKQARDWQNWCDELGIYADVASPEAITTMDALVGTWHWKGNPNGDSLRYDVLLHMEYFSACDAGYPGIDRDSLTRYAVWTPGQNSRRAIHIFAGPPGITGYTTAAFGPSAQCSTGVKTYSQAFLGDAAQGKTLYVPGKPYRWRSGSGMGAGSERPNPVALQTNGTIGGVLRSYVGERTNVASSDGSISGNRGTACDDCDSLLAGEGAFADTSVLWSRDMIDGAGPKRKPNIFCQYATGNGGGSGNQAVFLPGMALAIADSILGNRLIGQKPGWNPIKVALLIQGPFSRSKPGVGSVTGGNASLVCLEDSTRLKAMVRDSIDKKLDIPFDLTVNPDSVQAYAYEVAWYAGLKNAKFIPLPYTAFTSGSVVASKYYLADPFGRRGNVGGYGSYGEDHASVHTTTSGIYYNAYARVDSVYPGKVCYAAFPPASQLIPSLLVGSDRNFAAFPAFDSVNAALWWGGIRVVVFNPDNVGTSVNTSYSVNGGNAFVSAGQPYAFFTGERRFPIWGSTRRDALPVGSLSYVASQLEPSEACEYNLNLLHDYAADFGQGLIYGIRLYTDQRFYYHAFRTKNHVFRISIGSLHGEKAAGSTYTVGVGGSSDWPRRWGWWQIKSAVYPTQAINYFAGRTVIQWVHTDEL